MTTRLFIAALALLGIYAGFRWAAGHGMPTESAPLEMKTEDFPLTLGDWKGEEIALDPDLFDHIGAKMVTSRAYRDRRGRTVWIDLAAFDPVGTVISLPHNPEECYPSSGWNIGEPTYVSLEQGGPTQNTAKLLPVERNGRTACVLFWYQVGGVAYTSNDRCRNLMLGYRGRPVLPPVVKVMLQTTAASAEEAEKTLTPLARDAFKWTREFR